MLVTVAICTWNRSALLRQTLVSLQGLVKPSDVEWELLVIDNNCTDDTPAVVEEFTGKLPIRRIVETKQGHSHARNRAVDEARGSWVLWTDDDVLVDPQWLTEMTRAIGQHPEASFFGGYIEPWFEVPPPRWIEQNRQFLTGVLVTRDLGAEPRPFGAGEFPFGANMAIRTDLQREHRFNPRLGRVGAGNVVLDETDLFHRLVAQGYHGVWVPAARVRHWVPSKRMTRQYVWDYFFGMGQAAIRTGEIRVQAGESTLFGAPRWMRKRELGYRMRSLVAPVADPKNAVLHLAEAARWSGMVHESKSILGLTT